MVDVFLVQVDGAGESAPTVSGVFSPACSTYPREKSATTRIIRIFDGAFMVFVR
jgi:hypothetical protein